MKKILKITLIFVSLLLLMQTIRVSANNQVTVTFEEYDKQPFQQMHKVTVEKGAPVARPQDPTRLGYIFKGWSYAEDQDGNPVYWDFSRPVTENMTLHAVWKQGAVVSFEEYDKQPFQQMHKVTVEKGAPVARPQDPTRLGYIFKGWSYAEDQDGNPVYWDFNHPVTENMTLYAVWKQGAVVSFEEYDKQPFQQMHKVTVEKGAPVARPQDPTRLGYIFKGWSYAEDQDGNPVYWDFNRPVTENMTLYAVWKQGAVVSFEEYDKQPFQQMHKVTVEKGAPVTRPQAPIREGYIFKGWSYAEDQNGNPIYWDFSQPVTDNMTLHAVWKQVVIVGFEEYEGQLYQQIPKVTIEKGTPVTRPQDPTREGYIFKGWSYAEDQDGNPIYWDFSHPVNDSTMLHAVWERESIMKPVVGGGLETPNTGQSSVPETGNSMTTDRYLMLALGSLVVLSRILVAGRKKQNSN